MRYQRSIIVIILVLVLALPAFSQQRNKTTQEIKAIADPILDNILEGFKYDNYLRYSRDFDSDLKVLGSRTKFFQANRRMQKTLGSYLSRDYLGSLYKSGMIVALWKAKFDKTNNDVLIKLVLKNKRNRYVVMGLWLQ